MNDDPYIDINLRDETARVVYPTRQNYELDEIERLSGEVAKLQARLEAIKAAFQAVYDATPPRVSGTVGRGEEAN